MKFEVRKTALQNKLTLNCYYSNGKQTAERLLIYQLLRCFRVAWSQFWTASKCLLALETTTNIQEVKRSLNRQQNVNNLPKDYMRTCLTCRSSSRRVVQLYRRRANSPGYRTNLPFSRTGNRISRIKATLNFFTAVMLNVSKCTLIKTIYFFL